MPTNLEEAHEELCDPAEQGHHHGDSGVIGDGRGAECGRHEGHDGGGPQRDVLGGPHEAVDEAAHERGLKAILQTVEGNNGKTNSL